MIHEHRSSRTTLWIQILVFIRHQWGYFWPLQRSANAVMTEAEQGVGAFLVLDEQRCEHCEFWVEAGRLDLVLAE